LAKVRFDKLLIVDIEATCWESRAAKPKEQHTEIIEVGICTFDIPSWTPEAKSNIVVVPTQSDVTKYCTDLTTWTLPALQKEGVYFQQACKLLQDVYDSKRRVWASWGDYDRTQFYNECRRKDVPYPFGIRHVNLKTVFSIHHKLQKELGMHNALKLIGLDLEGRHHLGMDDAWNIGRILQHQGRF
jgi:inhibitor of KinA sporulation pathway (predicted exonuclease)